MKTISILLAALLGLATIPAFGQNTGAEDTAAWTEIDLPPESPGPEATPPATSPVVLTLTQDEAMIAVDALRAASAPKEKGWTGFSLVKWWNNNWKVITGTALVSAGVGTIAAVIDHNSGGSSKSSSQAAALPTVGNDQTSFTAVIGDGAYGNTINFNTTGQQGNTY